MARSSCKIEGQPTKTYLMALWLMPWRNANSKPMRWADKTVQFIRPVHTVTMLLGDELIEGRNFRCSRVRAPFAVTVS